jgi:small subunit ribosomal protein S11
MNKKNNNAVVKEEKKVETKKTSTFKAKKKIKKNITSGIAYVYSTFNNTIISIADESGNIISWSSAGAKGFYSTMIFIFTTIKVNFNNIFFFCSFS